ncbi:MAG: chloride channel protein, partial [Streptosporangiaceae bacterium]
VAARTLPAVRWLRTEGVVRWLRAGRGGLFLLALLIGAGAGLGAVAFRYLISLFTWLATGHGQFGQQGRVGSGHLPWLGLAFLVLIPVVGGLVYGPLIYRFAREARGHGVPEVMIAVADNGGRIRPQVSVVKALASALCIGTGGSVGREGPIVQIGSALASSLGQWVKMPEARLRALSYGTIYTTKLLRRGTDIDRTTPWRALADLKVTDAMHPLPIPLPAGRDGTSTADTAASLASAAGPVTGQLDPQAVFAGESLGQALRQLEVYGRDGLPVLSADGQQIEGWVTNTSVLQALTRQLSTAKAETARAQLAADGDTRTWNRH